MSKNVDYHLNNHTLQHIMKLLVGKIDFNIYVRIEFSYSYSKLYFFLVRS